MSDWSSIFPYSSQPLRSRRPGQDRAKGKLVPLTDHIALVSLTSEVSTRLFLQATAAVQKQITRDFAPSGGCPRPSTRSRISPRCRATTTPSSSSATPRS